MRDTELTIWQQVEQAYVNLISAEEQIGAAQKAVESAQENFRLSQGRFDAGVGTIIELTDAQLALTQAQSTQAQALTDYRLAIAQLEREPRAAVKEYPRGPDRLTTMKRRILWIVLVLCPGRRPHRRATSTRRAWAASPRSAPPRSHAARSPRPSPPPARSTR